MQFDPFVFGKFIVVFVDDDGDPVVDVFDSLDDARKSLTEDRKSIIVSTFMPSDAIRQSDILCGVEDHT